MEPDDPAAATEALLTGDLSDDDALRGVVETLAAARPSWGWVGIYLLVGDTLVLGPYVGPPTDHIRIPVGTGVCGTAVAEDRKSARRLDKGPERVTYRNGMESARAGRRGPHAAGGRRGGRGWRRSAAAGVGQ